MKKIIFLDIDGVIATPKSVEDGLWGLTNECQDRLGKILSETGAKIVLSSSWRLHNLEDTVAYMAKKGFKYCEHLIGVTIRAYHYIDKKDKVHLSIPRGVEIKQWIDAHIHSNNGKDFNRKYVGKDFTYLILDDDTDMLLEHYQHFVRTDSMEGLTDADVLRAVAILNKTNGT